MSLEVVTTPDQWSSAARSARSFNLFRRRGAPELRCAVPQDRAVPTFIDADGWEFAGTFGVHDSTPRGFDARTASTFAGWNGFYMFESWPGDRRFCDAG